MADPNEKIGAGYAMKKCCGIHWRGKVTILFPIITCPILLHGFTTGQQAFMCMYLVLNMSLFWITEAIPLYITSMLPVVYLPLFGILPSSNVCRYYFSDTVIMFIGGLVIALSIEYCNLHQRIALTTMLTIGTSPRRLTLGLTICAAFISMWISNSATTAMMCPIVKAVLSEIESAKIFEISMTQEEEPMEEGDPPHPSRIAMAFYFIIAYSSTIGGGGTLIGTATNLTFKGLYETRFPESTEKVTFPIFMAYSCPFAVVLMVLCMWLSLQITHMGMFRPKSKTGLEVAKGGESKEMVRVLLRGRKDELGPISCHEIQVVVMFTMMVLLLFTRKPGIFYGWADFLNAQKIGSGPSVWGCVIIIFMLPTQYTFLRYCFKSSPFTAQAMDACLSWVYVNKYTPFGLLFLLGGGFALSEASKASGMAKMLGDSLSFAKHLPLVCAVGMNIILALFCTAFSSNTAMCNILIPIFCEMAVAIKAHPLIMTLPAALGCGLAFHLPVSTPPNAIIAGYTGIKTKYMALAGVLPTFCAFWILLFTGNVWTRVIFPGVTEFPEWAN